MLNDDVHTNSYTEICGLNNGIIQFKLASCLQPLYSNTVYTHIFCEYKINIAKWNCSRHVAHIVMFCVYNVVNRSHAIAGKIVKLLIQIMQQEMKKKTRKIPTERKTRKSDSFPSCPRLNGDILCTINMFDLVYVHTKMHAPMIYVAKNYISELSWKTIWGLFLPLLLLFFVLYSLIYELQLWWTLNIEQLLAW